MRSGIPSFLRVLLTVTAVLAMLSGCIQPNSPPAARFTRSPSSGEAPLFVSFNASTSSDSDGYIASYSWAFGDGSSGAGVTASHSYATAGEYTAVLTVADDDGAIDSTSHTVFVQEPPSVDYYVTPHEIVSEFVDDEFTATAKYHDKTISVSGYVTNRDIGASGRPFVGLKETSGSPGSPQYGVVCVFPSSSLSELTSVEEDDYVTIVGEFDQYDVQVAWIFVKYVVQLKDCRLS